MATPSAALDGPARDASTRITTDIVQLSAIHRPGINVVVLHRELSAELRAEAAQHCERVGFHLLTVVPAGPRTRAALAPALCGAEHLARDIADWVEVLADLTGCDLVGARLARLDRAMCPRLHVDHVTLRIVTSYAGAGTQYADDRDLDRSRLGHAAPGGTDESCGPLRPGALVRAAGSGDIVLLKGERWPGNAGRGAVHRSAAASADHPRLVLTLDPLGS
jgi:hypothetical protein